MTHPLSNSSLATTVAAALKGTSLYLIGMMGSGKSTIAPLLAQHLAYQFFDTDTVIEQVTHSSIPDLFAQAGEESFRAIETQVLAELSPYGRKAIATGGGIVLKPENWSYLRNGVVIWLDVPLEILQARLQDDQTRPLLQGTELSDRLHHLDQQRRNLYAQADLHIPITPPDTPNSICDRILQALWQACQAKAAADQQTEWLNQSQPFQLQR
ncbi:MAG: shikimate kinase [Synechococcales bacterium]|nr:shikimate kinase [Synechococcales bacterium]